jgi:hypothetical protein
MKTCHSLLSAFFVFLLCLAGTVSLHAQTYGDFTYSTANGAVTITRYTGPGGVVAIPSSINGNPVNGIGNDAFSWCPELTSVTIPDGVTSIGDYAFLRCSGLTSATIGNGVTRIGSGAFVLCSSLTSVTIGNSVTSIENDLFAGCTNLTSVTIGNGVSSIGDGAFSGCEKLTGVTIPNRVTSIGEDAFSGCKSLTSMIIPNSVTRIGRYAFIHCSGLASVTIGNGVSSIEDETFSGCANLTSVTIPNSVTQIGTGAFRECVSLTGVTIPNRVTSIGASMFELCTGLESVTIPNSVTSIGTYSFSGCKNLTSVMIPNSVTSIGTYSFSGCKNLTSLTIPNSVTHIGIGAFRECISLTSVAIPACLTSVGVSMFELCTGLTSVTIPNSVTSIGTYSFSGCTKLTSVRIPDSVTSIGSYSFSGCTNLKSLTIGNGATSIEAEAFSGCVKLTSVTIPGSLTSNGYSAFTSQLTSLTFSSLASKVGSQIQVDFKKLGISGTIKLVGVLPTGLGFDANTGILSGKISGKAGSYPLTLQFLNGSTVTRSLSLPINIGTLPTGLAGTFQGLLEDENSTQPTGMVSLTVVAPGAWTATLDRAGSSKPLSAKGSFSFDPAKDAVDLTIPFSTAMTVHLRLDPYSALVSGDYPQGSIRGFRMASGSELPASNRLFTLTIDQGAQNGMTIPAGMGWATGTVSNKGAIALAGQLGDGKAIKVTAQLSATGQAIVWLKPYSKLNSFVGGVVSLRDRGLVKNGSDAPLAEGLCWYRAADSKELSYPNGFGPLQADVGIAPYAAPASAAALVTALGLPTTKFPSLIIDGGGLPNVIVASLPTSMTLDNAFKLTAVKKVGQTQLPWKGTVAKANGSFSGTLTLPTSTSDVLAGAATVSGVLLEGAYYSPYVGSGLVKIPLISPKGSFRTAAMVISSDAP